MLRSIDLCCRGSVMTVPGVTLAILVLFGHLLSLSDAAVLHKRVDPPQKLPISATINDLRYQPAVDFDTDSCYNVPAIDAQGNVAVGLPIDNLIGDCRDPQDLQNSNAYCRQRCNSGWCAYLYDYYFEKDYASPGIGHRNDWEHVLVFVPDAGNTDAADGKWVCCSSHGDYDCRPESDVRWDGDHPKVIYHKDGVSTHDFRFANAADDNIENASGKWFYSDLVSYNGFPAGVRDILFAYNFGSATMAIGSAFEANLKKVTTADCPVIQPHCLGLIHFPHNFDPSTDANGSPGFPPPPPPPPPPPARTKFMVVGDSISHGMEADWTWRWRLYAWLTEQGHKVDFVGPYGGTHGPTPLSAARPQPPAFPGQSNPATKDIVGLYASGVPASFTPSGHASFWGRQATQVRGTIQDWVATYQPDYLLILIGFNDLGWLYMSAGDLVGTMGDLVANARAGKSDVKILLGNVVERSFIGGRQDLVDNTIKYNKQLRETFSNWFRFESPIQYVEVAANYNCRPSGCPDGYDGLHPNSRGEYHIAQAFAGVLKNDFGFAGADFAVPANPEPRTVTAPSVIATVAVPEGLYTGWAMIENARGYEMRSRLQGMTGWWSDGPVIPSTFAAWSTWVLDGQTWEIQVRTKGDNADVSDWSALTSATAHPQTAAGPLHIISRPSGNGIQLSWDPVTGFNINRYVVIVWDLDTVGAFIAEYAESGTSHFVDGLVSGHRYGTWVSTWVNLANGSPAGGLPASGRGVFIGGGTPAPPKNLQVVNLDPTTVQLTWQGSAGAAGYSVYTRRVTGNTADSVGTTTETTQGIAYLYPGTWNFKFCVAAYNGNLESAHTACVIPPVYPGFSRRDKVSAKDMGNFTLFTNTTGVYSTTSMMQDKQLQILYKLHEENNNTLSR